MTFQEQNEAIAISGMGCRWPGGVRNTRDFWEFLKNRVDGWREFDAPRFSSKGFHHGNSDRAGTMGMKGAYLLDEDARLFDHSFFGMTGLEVETMDPSQRKLLEVTYEAFESAGESWESMSGTRTGVFVGNFCLDHWMIQSRDWDYPRPYAFTGAGTSILANRISYVFNLNGPSLTVDTACSSSMYALHLAVNAIRAGDCDAAVVASANWIADPGVQIALDKLGALSAAGRSRAFDTAADGYARGEGFGAIYLKRATLAVAEGLPMRALIRGSAMNANGRTGGITRPSPAGQEAVIREAYRNAGNLPFGDTTYFECHGTGTYVGDPLEVAAVGNVFAREQPKGSRLLVGSTKTNVGHGEGASALASIMKVVLALEQGVIPPVFSLDTLNPNIDFDAAAVDVVRELTPWPAGRLRRASINSFGYGGANAHCIIDHVHVLFPDYVQPGVHQLGPAPQTPTLDLEPSEGNQSRHASEPASPPTEPSLSTSATSDASSDGLPYACAEHHGPIVTPPPMARTASAGTRRLVLLPFAAHSKESLKLAIDALSSTIGRLHLADVAYTLSAKRSRLAQRTFRVVDAAHPAERLAATTPVWRSPLQPARVAFIFTGQGSQWPAMGAQLFEYRVFASAIAHLDRVLAAVPAPPTWTLRHMLSGHSDPELIHSAHVSQTVCTALQIGLIDLLASWSVRPVAVAGHSSGEIAAAYASGRLTAAEAIVTAYCRGQAVATNQQAGLMLAVGMGAEQALPYLARFQGKATVAAHNSPGSVTLSGDAEAIESLSNLLTQDGVFNRILKTGGNAYHSPHMLPLGVEYDSMLSKGLARIREQGMVDLSQRYMQIPWVSSATPGKIFSEDEFAGPTYWRNNLESPVNFSDAVKTLVDSVEVQTLVEIGPHPALKSPIDQILKLAGKTSIAYASSLKRQQDSCESMLQLAGTLFCTNADIDLAAVNALDSNSGLVHGTVTVDLPPYQYAYGPVAYHESRQSKEYRYRQVIRHDLLGSKVVGCAKLRPQWRNILRIKDVPWLGDHRLLPDAVFPAAGYIATAVEAARRIHSEQADPSSITSYLLRDVSIKSSLQIPEDDYGVELMTTMDLVDVPSDQTSKWIAFTMSTVTRDSDQWTEHCTGRIKVETTKGNETPVSSLTVDPAARTIDSASWYRTFTAIGLGYGPTFRSLSAIRADTQTRNQASATVGLKTTAGTMVDESPYLLHPASLDGAIQLGLIACYDNQTEEARSAFVPVHFSQLFLSAEIPENLDSAHVVAKGQQQGLRSAILDFVIKTPDGRDILQVESLRCASYSSISYSNEQAYSSPFTRLLWRPDIRTLDNGQCRELFPPPLENVDRAPLWGVVNKLAHAIVYNIYENFATDNATSPLPNPSGEVGHFFEWIKRRGTLDDNELRHEFKRLSSKERLAKIDELVSQAPHVIEVQTSKLLHDHMDEILTEQRTGIDVIISKDLLTPLYREGLLMTGVYPQLFKVLESLGHANPNMRYIEIGGGTGGATRIAMQSLRREYGIKSYLDYTFTDISPGFLATAREALSGSGFDDMIYNVLDVEQDPEENGYQPLYDVVLACQVLHATSNMKKTLANVGKLLKPGGKLVLVETTQNFIVPGVVVGTFTGYWAGIPDGRLDAPFMNVDMWDQSLKASGFTGAELVLDDFPSPHNTTSVIVSTFNGPIVPKTDVVTSGDIQLLHSAETVPSLLPRLREEFDRRELVATPNLLHEASTKVLPGADVIVFLDESHVQLDSDDRHLGAFQHLARSASTMTVLTSCGFARGRNPDGALISGLLRVLKTENPSCQFLSIDMENEDFKILRGDTEADRFARSVADQILKLRAVSGGVHDDSPRDHEFVWQDGALWVSRFVPVLEAEVPCPNEYYYSDNKVGETETEMLPLDSYSSVRAVFEKPGVLASLFFVEDKTASMPLQQDCVDVKITAISLAYDDLDYWSGRTEKTHPIYEFSGTVAAIGAGVNDLNVGDRVYGLSSSRTPIGNLARTRSELVLRLENDDDAVNMARLPRSYSAVVYALEHVARMSPEAWTGKTLLIQSATTDTGIAAIILALAKGANVFATVDNPDQAALLVKETKIAPSHVLSSNLRGDVGPTENGRFDVILSTASKDLDMLYLTPHLLKPLGHLIHMGPIEGQSTQKVGELDIGLLSKKNAAFSTVDLAVLVDSDSALGHQLLRTVDKYFRQQLINPGQLFTGTARDVSELPHLLGEFSKLEGYGGKLVITFANPESKVKMAASVPTARFDADACYVVTGALGGLGQSIVQWMTDRGARHLVLLSRRAIDTVPTAKRLVKNLSSRGVDVKPIVCDITEISQLKSIIEQASSVHPVKGIVHAAVSWHDLSFDKITVGRWRDSLAAKVQGTKNLHDVTRTMPLDFFVMTTSLLSVYALATQAAYTAANNFQEAFARHRRSLGLTASTVSFSLIRGVGDTGSNNSTIDTFERNKTLTLGEKQFLALLEPAFQPELPTGNAYADPLSRANLITCLDPAGMLARSRNAADTGPTPRWFSDGRVSLIMRAFADAQQHDSDQSAPDVANVGKSSTANLQKDFEAGVRAGPAERSATVALVEGAIAATVANMLFIDLEGVDPSKSVADYGVDSLIAAELRNWFLNTLKTNISMLKLLDQSVSISALAAKIVDEALAEAGK